MTREDVPPLLTLSGAGLATQRVRVGHITFSDRCRRPVGREKKKKPRCLIFGTRTIGLAIPVIESSRWLTQASCVGCDFSVNIVISRPDLWGARRKRSPVNGFPPRSSRQTLGTPETWIVLRSLWRIPISVTTKPWPTAQVYFKMMFWPHFAGMQNGMRLPR